MTLEITIAVLIWTILSITWFLLSMGNKFGENKWYDYILAPPVLIIAYIFGAMISVIDRFKGSD